MIASAALLFFFPRFADLNSLTLVFHKTLAALQGHGDDSTRLASQLLSDIYPNFHVLAGVRFKFSSERISTVSPGFELKYFGEIAEENIIIACIYLRLPKFGPNLQPKSEKFRFELSLDPNYGRTKGQRSSKRFRLAGVY